MTSRGGELSAPRASETSTDPALVANATTGTVRHATPGWQRNMLAAAIALALTTLGAVAVVSLTWPRSWDSSIMEYVAWLINNGSRPYRDVFDMNFPGAYLFHVVGQRLLGPSDLSFRLRDVIVLVGAMVVLFRLMRRFPAPAAACAVVLVTVQYLVVGRTLGSLQRDWLITLCAVSALLLLLGAPQRLRLLAAGAVLGAATMIRPTAALLVLLLPATVFATNVWLLTDPADRRRLGAARIVRDHLAPLGMIVAGAALSVVFALGWVVVTGGWSEFSWLVTDYFGLYTQLDGEGIETTSRLGSFRTVLATAFQREETLLMVFALPVVLLRKRPRTELQLLILIAVLMGAGLVQAVSAGKGWDYHFWTWMFAGLCVFAVAAGDLFAQRWHSWPMLPQPVAPLASTAFLCVFVWWMTRWLVLHTVDDTAVLPFVLAVGAAPVAVLAAGDLVRTFRPAALTAHADVTRAVTTVALVGVFLAGAVAALGLLAGDPVSERPEAEGAVAEFLTDRTQPGDRVQILATVGGKEAALESGAKPATPFIYDFHFFHHIGSPTNSELRSRFMNAWRRDPPDFVVVYEGWDGAWGPRLERQDFNKFPQLANELDAYEPVFEAGNAVVLERRG